VGRSKGFSGCLVCNDSWWWKRCHNIQFSKGKVAFPTCEECWNEASDNEIVDATAKLCGTWLTQTPIKYVKETIEDAKLFTNAMNKQLKER